MITSPFYCRHSGACEARARNPYSRSWLWIPRCAIAHLRPALRASRKWRWMDSCGNRRRLRPARQQAFLDRLDLQREMLRADAALREAAGDEPQARLTGARIHVA